MNRNLVVMIPVFNDWDSLYILFRRLNELLSPRQGPAELIIIDDGSDQTFDPDQFDLSGGSGIDAIVVLRLNRNLGHQTALAVGLAYLSDQNMPDSVLVMDGGGEDDPDDVKTLLCCAEQNPGAAVFAERAQRSESLIFRILYQCYKLIFRLFIGERIGFGNYSVIPGDTVRALINFPELWLSLPATIIRSRRPYVAMPTKRGTRYAGDSKLSLSGLIMHGLSAVAVFSDRLAMRMIIACFWLFFGCVVAIVLSVAIKLFTEYATPNWATSLVFGFSIISMILIVICLQMLFSFFGQKIQGKIIPRISYNELIASVNQFHV